MTALRSGIAWPVTVASTLTACLLSAHANAAIQEYQIVRLISYGSSCQPASLEDRSAATGPLHFHARCDDTVAFPDGMDVRCEHRDDERSCTLQTEARRFDQLRLLQP